VVVYGDGARDLAETIAEFGATLAESTSALQKALTSTKK
jgi:hypothetical protein